MECDELDCAHSLTRSLASSVVSFLLSRFTPYLQCSPQGQSVIESNVTRKAPGLSRSSVSLPGARFSRVMSFEDIVQFFKGTALGLNEEQIYKDKLEDIPKDKEDVAA